ncbi:MAG TPA: hypothetical protein VFQ44_27970 [Streptosporangiaceae bacterium]|nr:hypothetical protein [Streptosporangiaceae bacterium]
MRAITRSRLAPFFIAAALVSTGLSAHLATGATQHRAATEAGPWCPAGTNWDDILQACI